jgi:hypothetical protein
MQGEFHGQATPLQEIDWRTTQNHLPNGSKMAGTRLDLLG